jgi:signal peptidase I
LIWVLCIIGVLADIGYVVGIRKELFTTAPDIFAFVLIGFIILGCLSFLFGLISYISRSLSKNNKKFQNPIVLYIKTFFILAFLPVYILISNLRPLFVMKAKREGTNAIRSLSLKEIIVKILLLLFIEAILFPVWVGGYMLLGLLAKEYLGYNPQIVNVSGTGSMYPTFPKGEGKDPKVLSKQIVDSPGMMKYPNGLLIGSKRFFNYEVGRGDIVSVDNKQIREMTASISGEPAGWIKRLIGISGDTIELREGIVYLNGVALKEPYTAQPHSTFGESFLGECKKITVPDGSIFVMGDNRKGSGDSREIGFLKTGDIKLVYPLTHQKGILDKNWRDTSKDFENATKIKLDKEKYLRLLNEKRKEAGVKELKYQPKLETSANKRGEVILKYDDFSFDATRSGYTMEDAMADSAYSNVKWGEVPTQGYFDAEELIDNQFQYPNSKKFLTDSVFQEVGIAEVEGQINGCPTQVIVQHFAGYIPPNYSKDMIDSWKLTLSQLNSILPSWEKIKDFSLTYNRNKQDADRLFEIIRLRINRIQQIVSKMEKGQWLTAGENKWTYDDENLYNEQESLAKKFNSIEWQH